MKKVNLFLLEEDVSKISRILYDLELIEFFSNQEKGFEKYEREDINELSKELLGLRSAITILKKFYTKTDGKLQENIIEKTHDLNEKLKKIEKDILHFKDEEKRQRVLKRLRIKEDEIKKKTLVIGFLSRFSSKNTDYFKNNNIPFRTYRENGRMYFAAFTSEKIPFSHKEFYLPKILTKDVSEKLQKLEEKKPILEKQIEKLSNSSLEFLQREEVSLTKKAAVLEAKQSFSKTKSITVMSGHIESKKTSVLKKALEKELGNSFELTVEEAGEDAPIKFSNKGNTKNFESLLRMYSLPKYREIDPAFLMVLVFPLFYGFVLGDFGYGLLSFIVFTIAKIKMPKIREFLSVLQLSSISSMIFGIFYGEYFGYEPHVHPYEFHRFHEPETLLIIAVIFGLIHINIGFLFGIINSLKNPKKLFCDYVSWILIELGILSFVLGNLNSIIIVKYLGVILGLLGAFLLYKGHGFVGIIEIPSFFTNVLSYARLMAVGISSIVIAVLVNDYTHIFFSKGIVGIIGGILLFTIGHIFNIVLGNFESFLHTLRLHYVEFFTKFYSGGGQEFKPFGESSKDLEN